MTINMQLGSVWTLLFNLILLFFTGSLVAQEQIGLRVGNYSGVHGLALNPAAYTTNPGNLSVNLAGGYFFFENNYGFFRDESLSSLYRRRSQLTLVQQKDIDEEGRKVGPNDAVIDYFSGKNVHFLQLSAGIAGPSAIYRTNSGHQFGITTAVRAQAAIFNFPDPFSYYTYFERPFFESFEVAPFELAAASWLQVGFHYAYQFETADGKMGVGASVKWLQGMEAVLFENQIPFDYTKLPGDSISGNTVDLRYGFTNQNLGGAGYSPGFSGSGGALDLGFVYAAFGNREKYAWRLGVSLLDIGYMQYNRNTELHRLREVESTTFLSAEDYDFLEGDVSEVDLLVKSVSEDVLGDSLASFTGESFQLMLPAGASVQLDVAITDQFYINGLIVQGLPLGDSRLRRGSLLAVTPRFESKWFDAFLPVSVFNYEQLHVGLAARLGVLTIGSDNLSGLLLKAPRLTGTDFYLALHVPFLELGGGGSGRKRGRGKRVRCYEF